MNKPRLLTPKRWKLARQCLTERNVMVITSSGADMLHNTDFGDVFARFCMRMTSKIFYKARIAQERYRRGRK